MTGKTIKKSAEAETGKPSFSLISDAKLLLLYTTMVKSRLLSERVRSLVQRRKLGKDIASVAGSEAAVAGVVLAMLAGDAAVAGRGDFTVDFVKGVPLKDVFGGLFADATAQKPAALCKQAIRVARAAKKKQKGQVVAVFTSDADFGDALQISAAEQLPILFVTQGRLNAPELPPSVLPCIPVDGGDVVAVYRVATEAITHARKGNGPTLLHCLQERVSAPDPIRNMEAYLTRKGLYREPIQQEVVAGFKKELAAAIKAGKS
jgi:pyruvate dehydrogenase E1 component alpha subunit